MMLRKLALLALPVIASATDFASKCQAFNVSMPNIKVLSIAYVANGTNITNFNDPSCGATAGSAYTTIYGGDVCRLSLNISTSSSSQLHFEAWLPAQWNGRFLSTGNGGLGGCVQGNDIAYANAYGFAAVGTNNGHNGPRGLAFYNAPEVIKDFVYRSVQTGALVGKQLTESFYGGSITKSYYLGCSTGGRQGMKMVQDFPDLFDGVVAGAPAMNWAGLQSMSYNLGKLAGFDNTSSDFIPIPLWTIINNEVIRQCDGIDGALDGIIEDPDLCTPKLETLLCKPGQNASTCLNPGQYDRAVKIFQPLYLGANDLLYPRFNPGGYAAMSTILMNGQPFVYATDWWLYAIYNNPSLDLKSFGPKDYEALRTNDLYNISTFNGDISAFSSRGSKLIHYHGLADGLISSEDSELYYSHLSQTMSLSPGQVDDFYRYFRVPGMGHCGGGIGAYDIGNTNSYGRPMSASNKNNNVLLAIMAWVEQGDAPEYIEGIAWNTTTHKELYRRRHCKFPARNVYNGTGNGSDEDGWHCIT